MAVINGTFLPDILIGTSDDDIINGFGGPDTISGGGGNDLIDGGEGEDVLSGGEGNDTLIGGTGVATVLSVYSGGAGNDLMIASTLGLFEDFDGGADNDTVSFAVRTIGVTATLDSFGIPLLESIRNVENLIGSAFADTLAGNGEANHIDGGAGADTMDGGGGDDFLFVDDLGDIVLGADGAGYDNVLVSVDNYVLTAGAHVEVLSTNDHSGIAFFDLTGNELNNIVIGNAGRNVLDGGNGGIDRLAGREGDDFMIVDTGDVVDEQAGQGYDNVLARSDYVLTVGMEVEVLSTADHGGTEAIDLTGNEFANVVIGNAGSNTLDGSFGHDRLAGFGGADSYRFSTTLGSFNWDTIDGYDGDDVMLLEDAPFATLPPGALAAGAFVIGSAAADADDRIIYNSATGELFFDADGSGSGAQVQFALMLGAPPLDATDFLVI